MSDLLQNTTLLNGLKRTIVSLFKDDQDFVRKMYSHSIGAFVVAPIYTLLISQVPVSDTYFFIGISYTIWFTIYALICLKSGFLREKLGYFFSSYLFLITTAAFVSLFKQEFSLSEFVSFLFIYTLCLLVIQSWIALMLYNIYIFLLVLYGLIYADTLQISSYLIVQIFFSLGLVSSLLLHLKIKERKQIEDRSSNLDYLFRLKETGYVLFELDDTFRLLEYSNQCCSLMNTQDKETIEKMMKNAFSAADIGEIRKLIEGNYFEKTVPILRAGNKAYLRFKLVKYKSTGNQLYISFIEDVTKYVLEEMKYRHLEKKYKNLYFKNKAGVFTLNKKSEIVECNDSFIEMFEGTLETGERLFDFSVSAEWDLIIESLSNTGLSKNYQAQFILKNKVEKSFIFTWYLDVNSEFIEGSVIDITSIQKASFALKQSEEKYRLIYEESNDAILLLDGDRIVDVNRRTMQLFGIGQQELIGNNLFDLSANTSESSRNRYVANKQKIENKKSTKFEWIFLSKNQQIEARVALVEIIIDKKLYFQCVIQDNTEFNSSLRALEKNQRNLENILENNPEGILIIHNDKILYANTGTKNIFGELDDFNNLFLNEDQQKFEKTYAKHQLDKKRKNLQLRLNGGDKEALLMDVTLVSTSFEEEEATLVIIRDVSVQTKLAQEQLRAEFAEETNKELAKEIKERIKTERLLEEQYLRTRAIIDSSNYTLLLTLNLNGQVTSYNKHCKTYFSDTFSIEIDFEGVLLEYLKPIVSNERRKALRKMINLVKKGKSFQFEVCLEENEESFWLEVFMSPIFDTKGVVSEVSLVAHDSSEKKKASINIIESLKEKEVLLKEIHHRVKNNLQVISSILNLQSSFVTDEHTLEILQESRNRIRSMAIIHENLYRTEDFSSINFSSYLENLTTNLIASYRINEEVVLKTNLSNVDLVLDQAIPCGLLVNELITNALKYAWKNGEKGVISINLFEIDGKVTLEVADDGVGLPLDYHQIKTETLGLQLVETLVEQLDGEITVENENGTKYFIKFENTKH